MCSPFCSCLPDGLSMPIKLWMDGKVRELLGSAGGEGGGCGERVYTGDWLIYGLAVKADAMSCSCS